MYYLPILLAALVYLAFPSVILAVALGLVLAAYLRFGGQPVSGNLASLLRGQLAYRMLNVKLLALNGEIDEDTYVAHAKLTPDEPEAAELRGKLRDAAATSGAGWQTFARTVRKVYRREPTELLDRFENIILQMRVQPGGLSDESQARLVELAKLWKIGPVKAKGLLAQYNIQPAAAVLAWN